MTDYEEINFTGSLMWQLRILTGELCLQPHVCQPQFAKGHYLRLFSGRCFVTIKQYSQKHNCKFKYDKRTMWHSRIMWNKEDLRSKKEKNKCFTLYRTTNMLQKYKEKALWENTTDFSNLGKGILYILILMQKLIDWNVFFEIRSHFHKMEKKKTFVIFCLMHTVWLNCDYGRACVRKSLFFPHIFFHPSSVIGYFLLHCKS